MNNFDRLLGKDQRIENYCGYELDSNESDLYQLIHMSM